MKIYLVWVMSIVKFFLFKKRFLLISPPFLKKQHWYDRLNKKRFVTLNRDNIDWGTSWQVFLDDQFSLFETISNNSRKTDLEKYINEGIKKGKRPLIVDCGSNSGASCIYFNLTYPNTKIVAVEIDKNNIEHSEENMKLNSMDADLHNKGIASENGFGAIANPSAENNSYRISTNNSELNNLEIVSMQKILKDYPSDKYFPFIVKIDIEGGEKNLFSINTDWVEEIPMIIIELHDWLMPKQKTSTNFLKTVSKMDRDFNIKGENIFSIKNDLN